MARVLGRFEILGEKSFFLSVQRGLALVLPLVMIGALTITIRHFPVPAVNEFMDALFGPPWLDVCDMIIGSTFGISSLALVCAISGAMTAIHNQRHSDSLVTPTMSVIVVLSCFFVLVNPGENQSWSIAFSMDRGLIVALATAVVGVRLYLFLTRIKALQLPLSSSGSDAHIHDILAVSPAGMLTILIFVALRLVLIAAGIHDVHHEVGQLVSAPFLEMHDRLEVGLLYATLSQIFWFFGAHGPNLLFSVEETVLTPAALSNLNAYALAAAPEFILTKSFFDVFTRIGGSGSTLCLILAIFWKSRNSSSRKICWLAILPALCNVNEPLIYGIPLILNPTFVIPFVLTPVCQTLVAFGATTLGILPHTVPLDSWTMPPLLSAYMATNSPAGALIQMVNIALGTAIYIPFVIIADSLQAKNTKRIMAELLTVSQGYGRGIEGKKCLNHPGEVGRMAKSLAIDLQRALLNGDQLYLEFQPQIDAAQQNIHGAESLLRWCHPLYGPISPPITVALAEDTGCIGHLGLFILAESCAYRLSWTGKIPDDASISVNVSPRQLENLNFEQQVRDVLSRSGLPPHQLVLEIVESSILEPDNDIVAMLQRLQALGVRVAIDDFGMGHSSLRYLRQFPVNTVKIDRSLTEMTQDGVNDHIVRSIVDLSRSLSFSTLVEGVETEDQMQRFLALGCGTFQGYYFSKPLSGENCLAFMQRWAESEQD